LLVLCVPGRVLNRFTKDIGQLDTVMPWTFVDAIQVRMGSDRPITLGNNLQQRVENRSIVCI